MAFVSFLGGSWRSTVAFQKFNQVVIRIVPSILDVVSVIEQINIYPGIWHSEIDLAKAFFYVYKDHQKQLYFSWEVQKYIFYNFHQGYINYSTWCHNSVIRDLDLLSFVQNMRLVHYIDEIMLLGQSEEEVATSVIIGNIYAHEVDQINPTKIQRLSSKV